MLVYVISQAGKPLMPTRRCGKVRRLLKAGKARVVQRKPFTIKLLYETTEGTQPLVLGIDPGAKHIGVSVRRATGEVVYLAELETRSAEVTENLTERRRHRRERRSHRRDRRQRRARKSRTAFKSREYKIAGIQKPLTCNLIKPKLIRFHNRCRTAGWFTPTANHILLTHINMIQRVRKILPITKVCIEYAQFDTQKLQNPQITNTGYQNGRMKDFGNVSEYVRYRDKHTCQLCSQTKGLLEVHHVVWREHQGSDLPENLVTLCEKCHARVHKNTEIKKQLDEVFKGLPKRYAPTSLLNTIMPSFYEWLVDKFQEVSITYGYETKAKRVAHQLPKSHSIDAYLISVGEAEAIPPSLSHTIPYNYSQYRRHNRQLIHATRDRNYKLDNKIVAKNRHKRIGQLADSLAEFMVGKDTTYHHRLQVYPGTRVHRSKFDLFRRGDTVRYQGQVQVVKGYGDSGRTIGFVGTTKYLRAKQCVAITRNPGIVCL